MINKRKGLSPLVAAVLLIAFTMTVAALLTVWIKGFTDKQQTVAEESERKIECSYVNLEIRPEFASYNASWNNNHIFEAYIVNNGLSEVDIEQIQIFNRYGDSTTPRPLEEIINLKKDESKYVDINITSLAQKLGITNENDLDKVVFYTSCSGITARIIKPYGGWNKLDTPISTIIQVK